MNKKQKLRKAMFVGAGNDLLTDQIMFAELVAERGDVGLYQSIRMYVLSLYV